MPALLHETYHYDMEPLPDLSPVWGPTAETTTDTLTFVTIIPVFTLDDIQLSCACFMMLFVCATTASLCLLTRLTRPSTPVHVAHAVVEPVAVSSVASPTEASAEAKA